MEYIKNFNFSNIIKYFYPTEQNKLSDMETNETSDFIEYKDFMILDNSNIKELIDNFYILCDKVPNKEIEYYNLPNLTIKESIYSLDILISRPDIMDFLANNNNEYTTEVVSVICKLYLNIINKYNIMIDNETNIIKKYQLNFDLCEIIIKYIFVFSHPAFSKFFFDMWRYNVKKYYLLAKNNGCLISWITFSILFPNLANNKCYPIINKEGIVFKKINWEYIKSKIYFEKHFNLFIKYYVD